MARRSRETALRRPRTANVTQHLLAELRIPGIGVHVSSGAGVPRAPPGPSSHPEEWIIEFPFAVAGRRPEWGRVRCLLIWPGDSRAGVPRIASLGWTRIAVLLVVVSFSLGWLAAVEQNPTRTPGHFSGTPFLLQIRSVLWTTVGCEIPAKNTSGQAVNAGGPFDLTVRLTNPNASASCTLTGASVSPSAFELQGGPFPITLPGGASENLSLTVLAPEYSPPVVLSVALASSG